MPDSEPEAINIFGLDGVPGLGPVSKKRLVDFGIQSMAQIFSELTITELAEITGMDKAKAVDAFAFIRKTMTEHGQLTKMQMTAKEILDYRKALPRLKTGCSSFDELFATEHHPDGGLESNSITELYGANGSGKTQISHILTLNTLLEYPDSVTAYIDTETTFRPERIIEMAKHRKIEDEEIEKILNRIIVLNVNQADLQIVAVSNVNSMLSTKTNIKLIVVDSLTARFRDGFHGRGNTGTKSQKLGKMLHMLGSIAETWKIPIIGVNQIYNSPDTVFGDPDIPYGGNIVGHTVVTRVKLEKVGKGNKRRARVIKSSYIDKNEGLFYIKSSGIDSNE